MLKGTSRMSRTLGDVDRIEYPDGNWGYVPYAQYVQAAYPQGGAPANFGDPAPVASNITDGRVTIGPGAADVPGGSPRGTVTPGDPSAGYPPGVPPGMPVPAGGVMIAPDGSALIPQWVDEAVPGVGYVDAEPPKSGGGLLALLALAALFLTN